MSRGQHVLRIDTESVAPLPPALSEQLGVWAERAVADCDAVLLSDYGKGVLSGDIASRIVEAARRVRRIVIADPKGTDVSRFRRVTILKPNLVELEEMTGIATSSEAGIRAAGEHLVQQLPGTRVLVTLGADGMASFESGRGPAWLMAGPSRPVFDVTGAGDTVASSLALALAASTSFEQAIRLANVAAGVVVGKIGTALVMPEELISALEAVCPDFALNSRQE